MSDLEKDTRNQEFILTEDCDTFLAVKIVHCSGQKKESTIVTQEIIRLLLQALRDFLVTIKANC